MPDANIIDNKAFAYSNENNLVAEQEKLSVPNYFLSTQIFSSIKRNAIVEAQPDVLQFAGFNIGETHQLMVKFLNISSDVTRFHIIPPQTKYFKIHYKKPERLVPGFAIECCVEFSPNEIRYYYDAIRIHSKDEAHNLVIPIHAYPILGEDDFPSLVKFPTIPIGHRKTKIIPIKSKAPVDFEYVITIIKNSSVFEVDPLKGVIPANGEAALAVTFSPTDYITAQLTLQLNISQFEFKPRTCHIMGYSAPGIESVQVRRNNGVFAEGPLPKQHNQQLDPRVISPLDRARHKRFNKMRTIVPNEEDFDYRNKIIERDGFRIPTQLNCPRAVAVVLNQEPGKLKMKELREILDAKHIDNDATRQMKEALFDQEVRQTVYEERQNQLRWQVRIGEEAMTIAEKQQILANFQSELKRYEKQRGDPNMEAEMNRIATHCSFQRTQRNAADIPESNAAKFDPFVNDNWKARQNNRFRFLQAARKVIVRHRADVKLTGLRQLFIDWGKGKYANNNINEKEYKEEVETDDIINSSNLHAEHIGSITFPTHESPNAAVTNIKDLLTNIKISSLHLVLHRAYPYYGLRVPQIYKLRNYERVDTNACGQGYVPIHSVRPLRRGAEDEIISLESTNYSIKGDLHQLEIDDDDDKNNSVITMLHPPNALFESVNFPSLYIFNPAPGLQLFVQSQPYAETDPDFRLCPLPSYQSQTEIDKTNPFMSTQKQYLDREDTIRGVTSWKKFSSLGLVSLSNYPTLTDVWVPRWSDPFNRELLPLADEVPSLMDCLDTEDAVNIEENKDNDEDGVVLTIEMVDAAFSKIAGTEVAIGSLSTEPIFPFGVKLPLSNIPVGPQGPIPQWQREKELQFFLERRANHMGLRTGIRLSHMENLLKKDSMPLQ